MNVLAHTAPAAALNVDGAMEFGAGVIALVVVVLFAIAARVSSEDRQLRGAFEELQATITEHPSIASALVRPLRLREVDGSVYRLESGVRAILSVEAVGAARCGIVYVDAFRTRDRWLFASMTLYVNGEPVPLTVAPVPETTSSREHRHPLAP